MGPNEPLKVPGDALSIYIHSDGSSNDWGMKVKCSGILEEPSLEQIEAYNKKKSGVDQPNPSLACFLLSILAGSGSAMDQADAGAADMLYSCASLEILRNFLITMPEEDKLFVLHLLTNLLQPLIGNTALNPTVLYTPLLY